MTDQPRLDPSEMARIPFLQGLLPAEVEALSAAGQVRDLDPDAVVFRQGDPGTELFVIIDGEIAVELDVPGGSPRLLAALGSGTIFGEVSFLVGTHRTASARTRRPTRLLVFTADAVESLEGVGRQAATNMMETIARVLALRLSDMNRDLATTFARLSETHPEVSGPLRDLESRRATILHSWKG